jgi:hypothetical protein
MDKSSRWPFCSFEKGEPKKLIYLGTVILKLIMYSKAINRTAAAHIWSGSMAAQRVPGLSADTPGRRWRSARPKEVDGRHHTCE